MTAWAEAQATERVGFDQGQMFGNWNDGGDEWRCPVRTDRAQ